MSSIVSIIIPCYNGEKFIDNSIESVYIQDYSPLELIVVDDESTDGSAERIQAWQSKFTEKGNQLKYVYQKNRGLGGAIDTGLKHVTGAYLTLLDADDVFLPDAISKKARFLDEYPDYAGVRNNGWRVCGEERRLFINSEEEKKITNLFTALSFGKTNNWAGTYMIRTALLFEAYPDRNINPSRFGQNFQILLPISYHRKFGYIDEPLMEYRIQKNSHSKSSNPEKQYKLDEINAKGWRDIYMDILDRFVTDPQEYATYLAGYNSVFYRGAMLRAAAHAQKENLWESYRQLCKTGYASLNDHIIYASAMRSPVVIPLKIARRLKNIIEKSRRGVVGATSNR